MPSQDHIRNFCIIAHIDHGKSTLADRFLELTETVDKRKMHEQYLDQMDLERERGITIKMQPVRMTYQMESKYTRYTRQEFIFNLIDTPGHVDFSYEVSRALACVEGAILLVDSTQSIQAQTTANLYLAKKEGLKIIPVINKIDLPSARIEETKLELAGVLGCSISEVISVSAKTGTGVKELLDRLVELIPPPKENKFLRPLGNQRSLNGRVGLQALIFGSSYDPYLGVIAYVRIFRGEVQKGDKLYFVSVGRSADALEVGIFKPSRSQTEKLGEGEIGYIATGIKDSEFIRVGDTIILLKEKDLAEPLPGYKNPTPLVYASVFPEDQDRYEDLYTALAKLKLEDSSLAFEPEYTNILGKGFRIGFLGVLHMEIVSERLRREYNLDLVFTTPSVKYIIKLKGDPEEKLVYSAADFPRRHNMEYVKEPWIKAEIITPPHYIGALTLLISEYEGVVVSTETLGQERLIVKFESPLREVIIDFYDRLKSITQGFASMAYEFIDYRQADLVRMDILVAGQEIKSMSEIISQRKVYHVARSKVEILKKLLPRELFPVPLQAVVEGKVIARETLPALQKNVTAHLYGGDRTRKMKLWKKQKRGKKKLKSFGYGRIKIPPKIVFEILKQKKA